MSPAITGTANNASPRASVLDREGSASPPNRSLTAGDPPVPATTAGSACATSSQQHCRTLPTPAHREREPTASRGDVVDLDGLAEPRSGGTADVEAAFLIERDAQMTWPDQQGGGRGRCMTVTSGTRRRCADARLRHAQIDPPTSSIQRSPSMASTSPARARAPAIAAESCGPCRHCRPDARPHR